MAVGSAEQVRTVLKGIVRRTDGAVTRAALIESATLELGIDAGRVVEQFDSLNSR